MKTTQWVGAIIALAVMVFVITFAMNYLGGGKGGEEPKKTTTATRQLTFFNPVLVGGGTFTVKGKDDKDIEEPFPLEREAKKPLHHDFLFINRNPDPLPIGLVGWTPPLSSVQLLLLPDGGRQYLRNSVVAAQGVGAAGLLPGITFLALPLEMGPSKMEPTELTQTESVEVPAGAIGWVRANWTPEQLDWPRLGVRLWTDDKITGPRPTLMASVRIHPPLRASRTFQLGRVKDEEFPHKFSIICYSSTRNHLRIKAELARTPQTAPGLIEVGEPQRLSSEETRKLDPKFVEKETPPGSVRCAYRIPITLNRVATDGETTFDLGPFQRWVVLRTDEKSKPVGVRVSGQVLGLLTVSGESEGGGVDLDQFTSRKGKRAAISLLSETPGLTLKVDPKRTAEFLRVKVDPPETSGGGTTSWGVQLEVLPGRASGTFPRAEDPKYADSAIYLIAQQKDKPPRTIRIPVKGTASDE
jgi:hypothetical protein